MPDAAKMNTGAGSYLDDRGKAIVRPKCLFKQSMAVCEDPRRTGSSRN